MPGTKKKTLNLDQCPCAGRHLEKFLQPALLSALAGEPLHGYLLVQRLAAMPMFQDQAPDPTGVYRFLNAMARRGLVKSEWDLSRSGPAKKLFHLTDAGRECLVQWIATLERYRDQLDQMLAALRLAVAPPPARPRARKCRCGK